MAVALMPTRRPELLWRAALTFVLGAMLLAVGVLSAFSSVVEGIQMAESHTWNPRLGSAFALGIDGLALAMVLLTTALFLVAVLTSSAVREGARLYFALLLVLESAVLGVFMARDWSLFYVFWELTLIPLFFLIERLGGENRQRAALKFVLYTMGGSVFMLIALLLLYDASPSHSFAMDMIGETGRKLSADVQLWIFVGLAIGFGVKMPIFPLHGWLPLAHVEAPGPVSILLSGILLKMGAYGLLRAVEILPLAATAVSGVLAVLAAINLIYGSLLAWRQTDLKAMVAYSSIAHMGVVLMGIAALNAIGVRGAVVQMVSHGLVAGLLFLLVSALYQRTHSREISEYGNLSLAMPRMLLFLSLGLVAAIGLPGTLGFVAELQVIIGAWHRWGAAAVVLSLAMLITAAYSLRMVARMTQGKPVQQIAGHTLIDLSVPESLAALVLLSGAVILGVYPAPLAELVAAPIDALLRYLP
jgi:NADH-quinone oxidoreductase subunit M